MDPDIEVNTGYEVPMSDASATERVIDALRAAAAPGLARETPPRMGSEDFGSFGKNIPVVFWGLSASPYSDRAGAPNHSAEFMINEKALRIGVRALVGSTLAFMNRTGVNQAK